MSVVIFQDDHRESPVLHSVIQGCRATARDMREACPDQAYRFGEPGGPNREVHFAGEVSWYGLRGSRLDVSWECARMKAYRISQRK